MKALTQLILLAALCLTASTPIQATPPALTPPASATVMPLPVTVVVAEVNPPATHQLPTPAPTPTATATESPLAQAESTVIAPDGQRVAYFFGLYKARLIVTDPAGAIQQDIDEGNFGGGETEFRFVAWSADSQRLYFTTHVYFDGNGIGFYDGVGLRQLNVITGQIIELLPARDADDYWRPSVFALAPEESQLAYIAYAKGSYTMVLRNLSTGAERRLLLESYTGAGSLVWSPQGDQLALTLTTDEDWANGFTIGIIDTVTLAPPQVVYRDTRLLDPIAWTNANELVLRERGGGAYLLDLTSQQLRPAPTETP